MMFNTHKCVDNSHKADRLAAVRGRHVVPDTKGILARQLPSTSTHTYTLVNFETAADI